MKPSKKILIVDDDKTTASVMQLYIENFGFGVADVATTGNEAIEKAKTLKPDLVLMDIRLGQGLDGIDAAEVIMKRMNIPVVYVTAHADEDTLERAQMTNPAGFINKPLRETDLLTTIKFALEKPHKHLLRQGKDHESLVDILIKIYSLTPAEARVVAKLVDNPSPTATAQALGISISTVRTHLKRVYRKTNTNRQSALLHKIVTGPVAMLLKTKDDYEI
jgi:DNA-binding NarL/FixJ family response regulator